MAQPPRKIGQYAYDYFGGFSSRLMPVISPSVCTGSQNVIAYTTVHGLIIGWDLRAPKIAWKLENNPKHGK